METVMIILVLVLVGIIVYLFLTSKNINQSLQPWTGDESSKSFAIISLMDSQPLSQDILQQLVNELSRKVSFQDFVNANADDRYSLVYGVRGKWCDTMKEVIVQKLMKENNMKCKYVICIVGALEQRYSPKEINNFNEDQSKEVMKLMMTICQGPCQTPS